MASWLESNMLIYTIRMSAPTYYTRTVLCYVMYVITLHDIIKYTCGQFRGDGRTVRTLVFGVYKI